MNKGRVFIIQEVLRQGMVSAFDFTPAMEYGAIEILLPSGRVLTDSYKMVEHFYSRLSDFCDDDYILPTGDPAAMVAASMVAADVNDGRVKVLRWDKTSRRYCVIQIDLNQQPISENTDNTGNS